MTPRFLPGLVDNPDGLPLGGRSSGIQFRELDGVAFLNVPLVTIEAVKGIAKS